MYGINQFFSKKRTVIGLVVLLTLILLVVIGTIFYPFLKIGRSVKNVADDGVDWKDGRVLENDIIKCKFGLNESEYALLYEAKYPSFEETYLDLTFYKVSRDNVFSQNWKVEYDGYVDLITRQSENFEISFSELVELVENDCNVFRSSYPTEENPESKDIPSDMNWIYTPHSEGEKVEESCNPEECQIEKLKNEIDSCLFSYGDIVMKYVEFDDSETLSFEKVNKYLNDFDLFLSDYQDIEEVDEVIYYRNKCNELNEQLKKLRGY